MKKKLAAKLTLKKETVAKLHDPENALHKVAGGYLASDINFSGCVWCTKQNTR